MKTFKKSLALILVFLAMLSTFSISSSAANVINPSFPASIRGFIISTNNKTALAYDSVNGSSIGYIYASDDCEILEVYMNSWCRVRVPWSGYPNGRIVFTKLGYFFSKTGSAVATCNSKSPVYSRTNQVNLLGYAYVGDRCIILDSTSNSTLYQCLIPWNSGGFRLGWVSKSAFTSTEDKTAKTCIDINWTAKIVTLGGIQLRDGQTFYTYDSKGNPSTGGKSCYINVNGRLKYVASAQCAAFAYYCQNLINGSDCHALQPTWQETNSGEYESIYYKRKLTRHELYAALQVGRIEGCHIRYDGHSIILLTVDSTGLYTYIDANTDWKNTIRLHTATLDELAGKGKIMYIESHR